MTSILWLSNETPDRYGQGGQRRQYFQIRALARAGIDVWVYSLAGAQSDESLRSLARVQRIRSEGGIKGSLLREIARWKVVRRRWDGVVVAHTESWPGFHRWALSTGAPVWVDLHNVLSLDVLGRITKWSGVENDICRRAQVVSVCSAREEGRLLQQNLLARAKTVVLNHGIDLAEWSIPRRPSAVPSVKLFGNWGWDPNRRGLSWFLSEVWPNVAVTGAQCEIAGTGAVLPESRTSGVSVVGRVPSVAEWVADAWAVAVPVVGGVGAPVKYLEALASGVPVLATPDGAPQDPHLARLVSHDPAQWVEALDELLGRRPSLLGELGVPNCSWDAASSPLVDWAKR